MIATVTNPSTIVKISTFGFARRTWLYARKDTIQRRDAFGIRACRQLRSAQGAAKVLLHKQSFCLAQQQVFALRATASDKASAERIIDAALYQPLPFIIHLLHGVESSNCFVPGSPKCVGNHVLRKPHCSSTRVFVA